MCLDGFAGCAVGVMLAAFGGGCGRGCHVAAQRVFAAWCQLRDAVAWCGRGRRGGTARCDAMGGAAVGLFRIAIITLLIHTVIRSVVREFCCEGLFDAVAAPVHHGSTPLRASGCSRRAGMIRRIDIQTERWIGAVARIVRTGIAFGGRSAQGAVRPEQHRAVFQRTADISVDQTHGSRPRRSFP